MVSNEIYSIYHCKKHKITIHYFKKENEFTEYRCWDCLRDGNHSKDKKDGKGKDQG